MSEYQLLVQAHLRKVQVKTVWLVNTVDGLKFEAHKYLIHLNTEQTFVCYSDDFVVILVTYLV